MVGCDSDFIWSLQTQMGVVHIGFTDMIISMFIYELAWKPLEYQAKLEKLSLSNKTKELILESSWSGLS